jgi:hypothetical protein
MVVNSSSLTRQSVFAYARDFVMRYKSSAAIAYWELGTRPHDLLVPSAANRACMQAMSSTYSWTAVA